MIDYTINKGRIISIKKNPFIEKLGSQGSLGRQSHSRFEALFVPTGRKYGGYLKVTVGYANQEEIVPPFSFNPDL